MFINPYRSNPSFYMLEKIIMKKLLILIPLFSFGLLLVGCGKEPAETCSVDQ